jgi:hypothetical protein
MNEQPEALRLADELDTHAHHAMNGEAFYVAGKAAAELRRLQAELERLVAVARADEREACIDAVRFADNGTEAVELIRARGETK